MNKMVPNMPLFEENGTLNHMEAFFCWRSSDIQYHEKIFAQKVAQKFFGKFGKIRAKILCTPKHLPAPTSMPLMQCYS